MFRILLAVLALAAAAFPITASAHDRRGYDDYDYGYEYEDRYSAPVLVRCESRDRRTRYCAIDTRGGVRLARQHSRAACIQGLTWGFDRRGIWVSDGCRARFEVGGGYGRPGYGWPGHGPGYGYGRGYQVIRCESINNRPNFCRVPGGVRQAGIQRRLSRAGCQYNYSWGFQRDGIWVENGCRAEFRVY